MVVLSWLTLVHHLGAPRDTLLLPRTINFLVDVVRLIVSTAAFAALFLGETLAPHALAGAALFIAAVALVATRRDA